MKSVGEIQGMLVAHGAQAIIISYGADREPVSLSFNIPTAQGNISFRLPANVPAVAKLLVEQLSSSTYRQWDEVYQQQRLAKAHQQANKVAWHILKDWVDAQLAIIETEMVTVEQVFLPYMLTRDGKLTLYETMVGCGFQLPEGRGK